MAQFEGVRRVCDLRLQVQAPRGSLVRHYLWLQIFSGWLLSAILIAGVTGLMSL